MEQVSLMQQGIDLMLFGMGTVFTFLVVLMMSLMIWTQLSATRLLVISGRIYLTCQQHVGAIVQLLR